jgi:hypothetical protein
VPSLLQALRVSPPNKPLGEIVKVRIDADLRRDLDRIEAYARGAGYRDFSRSDLVRTAIAEFVDGVKESLPEVKKIRLPEEADSSPEA